jgi:hypothetical protein
MHSVVHSRKPIDTAQFALITSAVQSYFLAPHVYPCVTDDKVVLLDLQRDKYVGVGREQMASLAARVKGWPLAGDLQLLEPAASEVRSSSASGSSSLPMPSDIASVPGARADSVLGKMLAAGMLTTDPAVGKEATPVNMPRPEAALVEEDLETQPEITAIHVSRFLRASLVSALALKTFRIESVIAAVAARKAAGRRSGTSPFDRARASREVAAYIRLRPLLFGAQDACLFDSIALVRFLSYSGIFPTCVIGVQTGPFGAHCWVQHEAMVFNDSPEYVRRFTPILAV